MAREYAATKLPDYIFYGIRFAAEKNTKLPDHYALSRPEVNQLHMKKALNPIRIPIIAEMPPMIGNDLR